MTVAVLLLLVTFFVAFANGANDNFKGVATLHGSGTASFGTSLLWANGTTLAGAVFAVAMGHGLAATFGGKGLVPDEIVRSAPFLVAVGTAAAGTVLLATRLGLPVSTTHALMGALAGAGVVAAPSSFQFAVLGSKFLLPLVASPFAAFAITLGVYPLLSSARARLGIGKTTCGCVGMEPVLPGIGGAVALSRSIPTVTVGAVDHCREKYEGQVVGVSAQAILDTMHFASAGAVGFARGLNDAPKIAALALAGSVLPFGHIVFLTAGAMLLGGILAAKRVGETMSHRITTMNDGQGFTANIVTASLVLLGSAASLPLSTTHVSCGALFGLGAVTKGARGKMIARILGSWIATLPVAAALGAASFALLR